MSETNDLKSRLKSMLDARAKATASQAAADQDKADAQRQEADLIEFMQDSGLQSVKIDGVHYAAKTTVYATIQDRDALQSWLENSPEADDDLMQFRPVAQRLNEIVRTKLANEEELPPGLSWRPKHYVSVKSDDK